MNTSFEALGLSEATLSAVTRLGYTTPTPVQSEAIPIAMEGRDIVAAAKTGTGKTAAFVIPVVERIARAKRSGAPSALIVSPTRELAQQIETVCVNVAKTTGHRVALVVGGMPYGPQIKRLKQGVDILIATPGRLNDLMDRGTINLSRVKMLVIDEADRMLDMGFWPTMEQIIGATPENRQTLLFSATIDRKIMRSVEDILHEPAFIEIAHRGETADMVDQFVVPVSQSEKSSLLCAVLKERGSERIIVFARTKDRTDDCADRLCEAGYDAESIHSGKSQWQRRRALDNFSKGKTDILVATDVLARGIDVSNVEHIINYDLPDSAEDYVHRIGRTGRAGKTGDAISFVSSNSRNALRDIERLIGKKIPSITVQGFTAEKTEGRPKRPGSNNRRPSTTSYQRKSGGSNDSRPGRSQRSASTRQAVAR